ncbi:Gp37-like protein [Sutcliffiella horikoshii]|uniref:Gp37-like protein n=1 Tax=Sutcliffiella horikoshii TaxID=79883 RepID=UPI003CE9EB0E
MWNVFEKVSFERRGVVEFSEVTINHNYFETDTLTFTIPYTKQNYDLLKEGYVIQRKKEKKGFLIHTIEILEGSDTIWGYAYGFESILDDRVVIFPRNFNTNAETIMHTLVNENMINAGMTFRNFNNLTKTANQGRGSLSEESYWGESLYKIFTDLSRRFGIGFKIHFLPRENRYEFFTYVGNDHTVMNAERPIRWVHEFNDTYDESLITSVKNEKTHIYVVSGDETPEQVLLGDELAFKQGFLRKETFHHAVDITKTLADENQTVLTLAEVHALLRSRGKLELLNHRKVTDYEFTLSETVDEKYGIDFFEGDLVSVVHQGYGIVKHQRIATVEEVITGDVSRFNVKFDK